MISIREFLLGVGILTSGLFAESKPATFLLEGNLLNRDAAVNGLCQFRTELWDRQRGSGTRTGPRQSYEVYVEQGHFRIRLNEHGEFGANTFQGQGYWLDLGIKCPGDRQFVPFEGRQWVGTSAETYDIGWWTVDGGGGTSAGASLELTGSIGQPDTGTSSNSSLTLLGGFWGAPGSGYRIHLPTIVR